MPSDDFIMPQPDVLNEFEHGRFVLTNLAALRAKQLKDGAAPLVRVETSHPLSIALAEIAQGKIKPIFKEIEHFQADEIESEELDFDTLEAEGEVSDFDLQLPAVDEDDDEDTVAAVALDVDDIEEEDAGKESGELGDLLDVGDDDEEREISDEISLEDLAEEEDAAND